MHLISLLSLVVLLLLPFLLVAFEAKQDGQQFSLKNSLAARLAKKKKKTSTPSSQPTVQPTIQVITINTVLVVDTYAPTPPPADGPGVILNLEDPNPPRIDKESGPVCGGSVNGVLQDDCNIKSYATLVGSAAVDTCWRDYPGTFWDGVNGGGCWKCPSGYDRTWDSVTSSTACLLKTLSWQVHRYPVGLFNVPGVKYMLAREMRVNPQAVLSGIEQVFLGLTPTAGEDGPDVSAHVATIRTKPGQSEFVHAFAFGRLMQILTQGPRDDFDKWFLSFFADYMHYHFLFYANEAELMYQNYIDTDRIKQALSFNALDFGSFPPDFSSLVLSGAAYALPGKLSAAAVGMFISAVPVTTALLPFTVLTQLSETFTLVIDGIETVVEGSTILDAIAFYTGPVGIVLLAVLIAIQGFMVVIAMSEQKQYLDQTLSDAQNTFYTLDSLNKTLFESGQTGVTKIASVAAAMFANSADNDIALSSSASSLADYIQSNWNMVSCTFTCDNIVSKFYLDGQDILSTAVGNVNDWTSPKAIRFVPHKNRDSIVAVICAEASGPSSASASGFTMQCKTSNPFSPWNFVTTFNTENWLNYPSLNSNTEVFDPVLWTPNFPDASMSHPIASVSGFGIPQIDSRYKIWGSTSTRFQLFRKTVRYRNGFYNVTEQARLFPVPKSGKLTAVLQSSNNLYEANLDANGFFYVVNTNTQVVAWSIPIDKKAGVNGYLTLQTDSNLVVYTSANAPTWATGTYRSGDSVILGLQDDGSLVIISMKTGIKLWSSSSN